MERNEENLEFMNCVIESMVIMAEKGSSIAKARTLI